MVNKQQLLASMHVFSVSARHLSFTKAADELFLTQGAVSQRIKKLERDLGFSLFIRLTRKLQLTPEGERLFSKLNLSFDLIFSELEDIKHQGLSGEFYIGSPTDFASTWLIPRLHSFQNKYPDLNIKLLAIDQQTSFEFESLDAAIYYSEGEYPNCYSQRLFNGQRTPVCTPEYAKKYNLDNGSKMLEKVNFIHFAKDTVWKKWLRQQDLTMDCNKKRYLFSDSGLTIDAVKGSLGVAMGRLEFIEEDIKSGRLISPFPIMESGKGYDLVCPLGLQKRAKFQAFQNWIMEIVRKEK